MVTFIRASLKDSRKGNIFNLTEEKIYNFFAEVIREER